MNDFYVGYLSYAPSDLARFARRVVISLMLLVLAAALLLVVGQTPFANSTFEFGKTQTFEGIIETAPYPVLLVARPGKTERSEKYSRYLLVAPGKHGAGGLVVGLNGKQVRMQGQLIYRAGGTMIEVKPGSLTKLEDAPAVPGNSRNLGSATLEGEIVDSKCYLGVMNPGQGKVHRDCAARCLSGGIPPLFVTEERGDQYVLTDSGGNSLRNDILREFVGESISLRGEVVEIGEVRQLRILASSLHHTSSELSLRAPPARK